MKFVLLCVFAAICAVSSFDPPPYQEFWYDQIVDHFNWHTAPETFKQRYLVYDGYFHKSKNRIFFYTGNEGPIDVNLH